MRRMKKLICVLLCFLCIVSLCGCGVLVDETKEQQAYNEAITALFDALDKQDKDGVYNLFSPGVKRLDTDLKEQIDNLMNVYSGPTSEIGWDGMLSGDATYENGEKIKDAYAIFPVRSENNYYWFYLKLIYENTIDEEEIGVVRLDFYTADEYSVFMYEDGSEYVDSVGLSVYAEKTLEDEVRCINGFPYRYSPSAKTIDLDDVKDFLASSQNLADFKARFGDPAADCYYQLPQKDGKQVYLEVAAEDDGTIIGAYTVDDFKYLETVFEKE